MIDYKALYDQAKKDGTLETLTPEFFAWTKEKQFVIGRLVDTVEVLSKDGKTNYLQYLLETDKGLVKFALGSATDKEIAPSIRAGRIYRIEFGGQESIKGGRHVNKFHVERIPGPEEEDNGEIIPEEEAIRQA